MLRRRHKKSRAGCLECKRRHVKCDERHPVCSLCSVSDRKCTFPVLPPPEYDGLDSLGGTRRATSPSVAGGAVPRTEPAVAPALPVFPAPSANNLNANHTDPLLLIDDADAAINISHAELIVHLMTSTDIQSLAASHIDFTSGMVLGLRTGIRTPYLLYAMLAFSARHLAFLAAEDSGSKSPPQQLQQQHAPRLSKTSSLPSHSSSISQASSPAPPPTASTPSTPQYPLPSSMPPLSFVSTPPYVCQSASSAARYQRQAVLLQTRAISLFNTAWRVSHGVIDRSNCVPMLLFSSVLGHHLFADSLSRRDDSLELFLEHYVQCSQLQRGVHDIAITTWPFLIASEFAPILQWSARFTSRRGRGNDCDQLLHLVDSASDGRLTTEDKDACRLAIRLLQVGFDVLFLPAPPKAEPKYAASSQLSGGSDNSNTMDETPDEMANTPSTSASTPSSSSSSPTETEPDDDDEKAEHAYRHKMIFLWALIMPKKFADLLSVKNPEALVILAYYSLLLHHGKHLWQVGDAGEYVMGLVTAYLGPSWDNWLEYPRQRMATDVVEAQSP